MAPGSGNGTFAWTDRAEFSNDMILVWLSPHGVLGLLPVLVQCGQLGAEFRRLGLRLRIRANPHTLLNNAYIDGSPATSR
jgi:hypothetical protein